MRVHTTGDEGARRQSTVWLYCPQKRAAAKVRLLCFPSAGGGTAPYRTWPEHLPPEVEVQLVQLPGRERRFSESPVSDLATLLEQLVPALEPLLDRPYALFGHSMGALICFEVARALVQREEPGPVHLLLSSFPAPHLFAPAAPVPLHSLPDAELLAALRRSQATPEVLLANPELMELTLPTLRADQALVGTYRYTAGQKLSCPLSVYGGQEDAAISASALAAWSEQTTGPCHVRLFSGGHLYFHGAEEVLAEAITQDLQPYLASRPSDSMKPLASLPVEGASLSSEPGAPEVAQSPTALPPPARVLRLVMLGVLGRAERVDFKIIAVISRKFGSRSGQPASVAEQVHALAWLIDRGFARMQARQERDFFWEQKRERLSFSLDERGRLFLKRLHAERWEDESPEYAALEEGGPELTPSGVTLEQHLLASLQVGTSDAYPALDAPVKLPDLSLSTPMTVLVWGLVAVSVVALLSLLLFGGR